MSVTDRWLYALKPASWPKLLVPAFLGQSIGIAVGGRVQLAGVLLGLAFTLFLLGAMVLLNDWGDQSVDALKRRLFPEGSPKTIPDELLDERSVLYAGLGCAAFALSIAVAGEIWLGRSNLWVGGLACLGLFWAYSLPPIRLNYRGGGEVLEMLGVGFALPWFNAYLQSGAVNPAGVVVLPGFALLALGSALASGLADEPSDRLGGKRTFTTMFGAAAVRQGVEGLVAGAMIVWGLLPYLAGQWASTWMVLPALLVMTIEYRELQRCGAHPHVDTYAGTAAYKMRLHNCMWRGAMVLGATVCLIAALGGGIGVLSP